MNKDAKRLSEEELVNAIGGTMNSTVYTGACLMVSNNRKSKNSIGKSKRLELYDKLYEMKNDPNHEYSLEEVNALLVSYGLSPFTISNG